MFFILSKVLDFFLSPLVWVFMLLLVGFLARKQSIKMKFFYASFFTLLIFSNPFLADMAFRAWEGDAVPMSSIGNYETGIVLTGVASVKRGAPDRVFFGKGADRVVHAVQLYKAGKIKRILISGGSGALMGKKVRESEQLKKVFLFSGVPDSVIDIENSSRNTMENARFSRRLIDSLKLKPRFLLITSAFHMPRAMGCFKKAGIAADAYTTDFYIGDSTVTISDLIIPSESALMNWSILIHEVFGYWIYRLMAYA